jgi:hypothetical protein
MNAHYTDVDRMILSRWNEVAALQDAYDSLLDRMEKTISSANDRVGAWLTEQGYQWEADARQPYINAWKKDWEKPKGQPLVHFQVADFTPIGYGKATTPHPFLWLFIDGLDRIRFKEDDCRKFSKELRAAVGPQLLAKWDHQETDDVSEPLGRYCTDITESGRLDLVSHPSKLVEFVESGFLELFELTDAVNDILRKHREPAAIRV